MESHRICAIGLHTGRISYITDYILDLSLLIKFGHNLDLHLYKIDYYRSQLSRFLKYMKDVFSFFLLKLKVSLSISSGTFLSYISYNASRISSICLSERGTVRSPNIINVSLFIMMIIILFLRRKRLLLEYHFIKERISVINFASSVFI